MKNLYHLVWLLVTISIIALLLYIASDRKPATMEKSTLLKQAEYCAALEAAQSCKLGDQDYVIAMKKGGKR